MKNEPCSRIRNPNLFGKLKSGDALPGSDYEVYREQLFIQRHMRTLENSTCADCVDFLAIVASPIAIGSSPLFFVLLFRCPAERAYRLALPSRLLKVEPRRVRVWEALHHLEGRDCNSAHSTSYNLSLVCFSPGVKNISSNILFDDDLLM
jgi:hypothetical protein